MTEDGEDGVNARQRNCRERWLLGGDEECVEGFVDFDVAGKGVVSGALAGEGGRCRGGLRIILSDINDK